jgi:Holliday junction resolvasome RuvABC endonuclease subunit
MIVAGIDPSLTCTGVAVITDGQITALRSAGWHGQDAASEEERSDRVVGQMHLVFSLIPANADLVVIERPLYRSTTGHAFDRAGLWRGLYAQIRSRGTDIALIHISTLKIWATGKGNAEKDEIVEHTQLRWPDQQIRNDNEADALSLAEIGAVKLGEKLPFVKPRHHLVLQKSGCTWPTRWRTKAAV